MSNPVSTSANIILSCYCMAIGSFLAFGSSSRKIVALVCRSMPLQHILSIETKSPAESLLANGFHTTSACFDIFFTSTRDTSLTLQGTTMIFIVADIENQTIWASAFAAPSRIVTSVKITVFASLYRSSVATCGSGPTNDARRVRLALVA